MPLQVVKTPAEYPPAFLALMREAEVPLANLDPKRSLQIAAGVYAEHADIMRGLAQAYGVTPAILTRAIFTIGLEYLLELAEKLGHATQAPTDGIRQSD